MPIANNEVFGPVLSVVTWRDEEEAAADRQRGRVRPHREHLHARPRTGPPARAPRRRGVRLVQRDGRALPRRAVRRLQELRRRARGGPLGGPVVHAAQDGQRGARLMSRRLRLGRGCVAGRHIRRAPEGPSGDPAPDRPGLPRALRQRARRLRLGPPVGARPGRPRHLDEGLGPRVRGGGARERPARRLGRRGPRRRGPAPRRVADPQRGDARAARRRVRGALAPAALHRARRGGLRAAARVARGHAVRAAEGAALHPHGRSHRHPRHGHRRRAGARGRAGRCCS